MPLRQYAYFALFSQHVSADDMTFQLGMMPDEVTVRGSRFHEPTAVPVNHSWMVVCREPGLRVDEQITRILDRLQPHTDRICDLTGQLARTGGGAVLQIVRYFNDTDQAHPDAADAPSLLGWHLDRKVLDFLSATGAELDIDEYDMAGAEDAR
ncbi:MULTISPECIES: DUF4279 domain-containing protein [Streptomyces]|uniref:DUF4279 domain-containing protein n=1 Tax=Streptomyces sviceus (strain ATCC 29083 / DSM 924 / JCM 4929 / NBRC 13980 / NCIMB 11184 / NRRL 5439 / UC 5370) TaxID=463191 RepID=B5I3Q7_STRX2|nr:MULTISPECIES: DUF4279 domain-containing protein [Streptomyces]EDY59712.1 conserved hypothetical protein [Streptomyces sviceus ATCC 29083]MYT03325.1 DUF4279 domain-containing protein [Streptomyces sp. SID5470]